MKISIVTLFPDFFTSPLESSMIKRAQSQGVVEVSVVSIREHAPGKHRVTDDRPFGGGAGMVLMVEPIDRALSTTQPDWPKKNTKRVLTSPKGRVFTQEVAREYAALDELVIVCGHYEGVDQRVSDHLVDEEVSIGSFVLTGGEPAGLVMLDSIVRLLPGTLGNPDSLKLESHDTPGYQGPPQYTRPATYKSWEVPPVLLSGDHAAIQNWKTTQANSKDRSL